jgi:Zn-dependent M28 family amino/carboxypeptidase
MRVEIDPATGPAQTSYTYHVVGILRGADPTLGDEAILITAHLDHLGRNGSADGVDTIFNGADDDASGTVAVMEIAPAVASRARPKRTVILGVSGVKKPKDTARRSFARGRRCRWTG